ncbi:MAG: hypothetical protein ACXWUN_06570, partial [Allosphingosinicella sp.]
MSIGAVTPVIARHFFASRDTFGKLVAGVRFRWGIECAFTDHVGSRAKEPVLSLLAKRLWILAELS